MESASSNPTRCVPFYVWKRRTLLDATFNVFSTAGEIDFVKTWKKIEKPSYWCRMPNPLKHRQSFMFSDVLRLSMLMPFILRRFLKPHHIKSEALNNWSTNLGIRQNSVILKLCTCWAIEAKALKLAFSNAMSENLYQELKNLLNRERDALIQVSSQIFYLYISFGCDL